MGTLRVLSEIYIRLPPNCLRTLNGHYIKQTQLKRVPPSHFSQKLSHETNNFEKQIKRKPAMNTAAPAHSKAVISLLILAMIAMCSTAAQLRQEGCAGDLIAFSPCLPYVSSPPNNETASASSQCCSVFSSAFESTDGACLCYLLRQPLILGFPLNATKLLGLSSVCPPGNATSARNASLETFCSGFLGS